MAIENPNFIEATLTILANSPVELVESHGFDESTLTRLGAGTYKITPTQLLAYDGSSTRSGKQQIFCQSDGPNFVATQIQSDGTLLVLAYAIGGLAADTGARLDVLVCRMPNKE